MNPVYSLEQLKSCNRTQLWSLCRERGLKCYPRTADCVEAIFQSQQSVKLVAVAEVAAPQESRTCANCPLFQPFNDGSGRGLCCGVADTSLVVRDHHQQTQDCLFLIEEHDKAQNADTASDERTVPHPIVQSGSLKIKPVASDQTEVFYGVKSSGTAIKDENGSHSNIDCTASSATLGETAVTLVLQTPITEKVEDSANRISRAQEIEVLERHTGNRYVVRNRTNNNHYVVRPNHENPRHRCECGDANFRGIKCKHQIAVELQPPMRQIKKARELAVGDKIRHFDEVLKVCELHSYRYQGQIGSSELYGVRFALQLIPDDFKPKVLVSENYQEYYQNAIDEYEREKANIQWLYPVGEAEFEIAV